MGYYRKNDDSKLSENKNFNHVLNLTYIFTNQCQNSHWMIYLGATVHTTNECDWLKNERIAATNVIICIEIVILIRFFITYN